MTSDKSKYEKSSKAVYLTEKLNIMSEEAFLIKLCDRLDNVSYLPNNENEFGPKYKEETDYILKNLKRNFSLIQKQVIGKIKEKIARNYFFYITIC